MHYKITAKEFESMIVDTLLHEFSTDAENATYEDIYKAWQKQFCSAEK